jgi:hypothetical protein
VPIGSDRAVDIFCRPAHEFLQIIIQVHCSIFE